MLDFIMNINQLRTNGQLLPKAFAFARRHNAFLTGVQIVPTYPTAMAGPDAIALLEAEEHEAWARREWWLELCREAGVTGEWEVIRDVDGSSLARRSLFADLVIDDLQINDPRTLGSSLDERTHVLFSHASPLLLVPDVWEGELRNERVLIAWNGCSEAARAVKAALPLLSLATEVRVLDGAPAFSPDNSPPLPLREWLQHHAIHAEWVPFAPARDAGAKLYEESMVMRADLLVMGAWGRTRISERVLGGTTQHMVQQAQLPLLLSH